MRASSTDHIKVNKLDVYNRNRSQFKDTKVETQRIAAQIAKANDQHFVTLQKSYQAVKNSQNFAKANMKKMHASMMAKNTSFYDERIKEKD